MLLHRSRARSAHRLRKSEQREREDFYTAFRSVMVIYSST